MTHPSIADTQSILDQISIMLAKANPHGAEQLASQALASTVTSKTDQCVLLLDRALAFEAEGRPRDALVDFTRALEENGLSRETKTRALLERGLLLDSLDRYNDAIGDYTAALKGDPVSAVALNNRANVFRRQGRFSDARRDYLASLRNANDHPEFPYYGLGRIAEAMNDLAAARLYYTRALVANPDFDLANDRLAVIGLSSDMSEPPLVLRPPHLLGQIHFHPPHSDLRASPLTSPYIAREPVLGSAISDTSRSQVPRLVQLGAWRSEDEAAGAWARDVKMAGNILSALSPSIVPADLPNKGKYFRLRVTTLGSAESLCKLLEAADIDCMQVRP